MPEAYGELLLGRIDARSGSASRALVRFRRAATLAESVDNRRLAFEAQLEIFRLVAAGNGATARAAPHPWLARIPSPVARTDRHRDRGRRRTP